MKHLFSAILLLNIVLLSLYSCSSNTEQPIIYATATLRWTGPLAADGCGFFVDIEGKEYKPSNEEVIPESFMDSDSSQVQIQYRVLKEPIEYSCGMLPVRYFSSIELLEVTNLQ